MKHEDVCVLIMSCDKYADLWDPFFIFFEKNWLDCPFPIYLATNSTVYKRNKIRQIFTSGPSSWSEETKSALNQLPFPYVIYLQDDYFILKPVNTSVIYDLIDKLKTYQADYLRLFPSPGPDREFKNDTQVGEISQDSAYRTSLQCAIWRKETFEKVLHEKENQWQFETRSPERSKTFRFLSVKNENKGKIQNHNYPITYYYLTAIIRGKWRREALTICANNHVPVDLSKREVEPYSAMLYQKLYLSSPAFLKKGLDFFKHKFSLFS